jgi:carbon-monoxide dehydrogenase large subunit
VVDALGEFGVRHIEMPATPERVWRAIHGKEIGLTPGRADF